jgi:hypothetical protein
MLRIVDRSNWSIAHTGLVSESAGEASSVCRLWPIRVAHWLAVLLERLEGDQTRRSYLALVFNSPRVTAIEHGNLVTMVATIAIGTTGRIEANFSCVVSATLKLANVSWLS